MERMHIARGCIERGERKRQAALLHSCVLIIGELRGSLNLAEGGPLAQNLSDLYEYMISRLTLANSMGDGAIVLEVSRLLEEAFHETHERVFAVREPGQELLRPPSRVLLPRLDH